MRYLVLSPNYSDRWNKAHEIFKQDLFEGKDVVFFGPGYPLWEDKIHSAVQLMSKFNADILFVFHSKHTRAWLSDIELVKYSINYQVDYFPERAQDSWRNEYLRFNKFSLVIFPNRIMVDQFLASNKGGKGPMTLYLPFGVNTDIFKPISFGVRNIDLAAIMSMNRIEYPHREAVFEVLHKAHMPNIFLHQVKQSSAVIPLDKYISLLQNSKLTLHVCDRYRSTPLRCFEVLACGSVLFSDTPTDFAHLGFIDGVNYISYSSSNIRSLPKILNKILSGEATTKGTSLLPLAQIAENGLKLIQQRHTNKHRADKLWTFLKGAL